MLERGSLSGLARDLGNLIENVLKVLGEGLIKGPGRRWLLSTGKG